MKKIKIVTILLICSIFLIYGCQNQYSSDQLQIVVDEYLNDKPNVLGTIVKVDIGGNTSYKVASGYIDTTQVSPINPDTKFPIASITKVFTSVLVHQNIENGKVKLEDPIIKYLSSDWVNVLEKIEFGNEITVEQALGHRSGIADITEIREIRDSLLSDSTMRLSPLEGLKWVQRKGETKFKPGESFDYTNTNYILLGAMVEHLSGMSYKNVLKQNIVDRIGLKNTSFTGKTIGSLNEEIVHSYFEEGGRLHDGNKVNLEWAGGAGGIISNTDDLISFYKALEAGNLFDKVGTYEQMCKLVSYNEVYGHGIEVNNDPELGLYYGHKGSIFNTRTILAYFPEKQITISICHTLNGFSMLPPKDLMKLVFKNVTGELRSDDNHEAIDIFVDSTNFIGNNDVPANGEWDFDLKEVWSIDNIKGSSFKNISNLQIGENSEIYLFAVDLSEICILDQEGNLVTSFDGQEDGQQFHYISSLYPSPGYIHALDWGTSNDIIKTFDNRGNFESSFNLIDGVTPYTFINKDQYIAIKSGTTISNRPEYEKLLLLSSSQKEKSVIGKYIADEKLVLTIRTDRGRINHVTEDIEIFPRLIVHFHENMLYMGRSDRYLIKKTDLQGNEVLSFGIKGRRKTSLPVNYAEDRASKVKINNKEISPEMKEEYLAGFPNQHVYYTKITTDEKGLIYVFLPDIVDKRKLEIDIFSPAGKYLYHSIIKLPEGLQYHRAPTVKGNYLIAIVKNELGKYQLIKFEIRLPEHSEKINQGVNTTMEIKFRSAV